MLSWASGSCFFSNTIEGAGLLAHLKIGFVLLMLRLLLLLLGFPVLTVLALSFVSELELEGPKSANTLMIVFSRENM